MDRMTPVMKYRGAFAFFTIGSLVMSLFIYTQVRETTGVKSLYLTLGILIAFVFVEINWRKKGEITVLSLVNQSHLRKFLIIVILFSVFITHTTGSITIAVGALLPFAYGLILLQYIKSGRESGSLLLQLVLTFATTSYMKYTTTDFYIGSTDLIVHTKHVHELLNAGQLGSISTWYTNFPVLHLTGVTLSLISSITPNDSIVLLGIVSFAALLLICYSFFRNYTSSRKVFLLGMVVLSSSELYIYYSNYFFPQALWLFFFFFFLYTVFASRLPTTSRFTGPIVIFSTALILTHHLSFVLLGPILLVLLVWEFRVGETIDPKLRISNLSPGWFIIAITFMTALYHWAKTTPFFIIKLLLSVSNQISAIYTLGLSTSISKHTVYRFGTTPLGQSTAEGFDWLISLRGLYEIALVAAVVLGVVAMVSNLREYSPLIPFAVTGIFGAALLLDTPLSIRIRVAFPFSIFTFVLIGIGVHWLTKDADVRQAAICLMLVFSLASGGALMANNDIQNYTNHPEPLVASVSQSELKQVSAVSDFEQQYGSTPAASFKVIRQLMSVYGNDIEGRIIINGSRISSQGTIVVNENWPDYRQRYKEPGEFQNYVKMSRTWFEGYFGSRNKVYDAGEISISTST